MAVSDVNNIQAEKISEVELNDDLFSVDIKECVLHDVVRMQRANKRAGNACTKTRGELAGGGAKPWRQKGTGRARSGTKNSPIWRGGGTVFGPKPRDYSYRLPKKVRKLAIKMALSAKKEEGNLIIIDNFDLTSPKTKKFAAIMSKFGLSKALIVTDEYDENLYLSARNAVGFKVITVSGINVFDLLKYPKVILLQTCLETLEARLMA